MHCRSTGSTDSYVRRALQTRDFTEGTNSQGALTDHWAASDTPRVVAETFKSNRST
jgi:hypothetical protein